MPDSLFRKEVLESRQMRWLGCGSLQPPPILKFGTGIALIATVAMVCLLVFGHYTRRTPVSGQLVSLHGMSEVVAPAAGILFKVDVAQGQQVAAGQVLVVLSKPDATQLGGDTAAAVQKAIRERQSGSAENFAAQRLQLQAQHDGLGAQITSARDELAHIQAQLVTSRKQQALEDASLEKMRGLQAKQYISDLQVQKQNVAALEQLGKVQALEQQAASTQRIVAQLQLAQLQLPEQIAALKAAELSDVATLHQESVESLARFEAVIKAPMSGTVATLLGQEGEEVQFGQPILSLLPEDNRVLAQLLVPGRAIGFVAPGDKVLLRYEAYPYQRFGHFSGKVTSVTRNALSTRELTALVGSAGAPEPYYRVLVTLDRQTIPAFGRVEVLKPGLLFEADILGERRPLWQWLIEPVATLANKFGPDG